ncbi:hypothetical protein [Streptomyces sp. NPDC020747]|uniref:hypothetical protein n=1 Tax=Streptomyces sp. NPDC020747 TaxID=3365086 RepID=UPI0037A7E4C4
MDRKKVRPVTSEADQKAEHEPYDQNSAEARKLAEWLADTRPLDGATLAKLRALLPRERR